MTPECRAQTFLHFLDAYLSARENVLDPYSTPDHIDKYKSAREFLGTALVGLVTDAPEKVDG